MFIGRCFAIILYMILSTQRNKQNWLFSDDLHKNSLASSTVKLAVKYLLQGTKIEFSIGYCNNHFPAHNLSFHVSISVVLSHIMLVLRNRSVRRQLFKPDFVIMVKTGCLNKQGSFTFLFELIWLGGNFRLEIPEQQSWGGSASSPKRLARPPNIYLSER